MAYGVTKIHKQLDTSALANFLEKNAASDLSFEIYRKCKIISEKTLATNFWRTKKLRKKLNLVFPVKVSESFSAKIIVINQI